MTRRGFLALGAAATAATALHAETPQEQGRRIAEKTIQALGGDGFRFMQTRTEPGRSYSFYRDQITGLSIARIYTKYLPAGEVQRQVFGKKMDDAIILTSTDAWEVTYRGAKPLGAERVRQFHDTALHDVFYILRMRMSEPGLAFDAKGRDVVENQPVEIIEIFDSANRKVTVWVHADTMLPVKQSFQMFDPIINDRREIVTRYSKYREVGNGVMWPYDTERERDGEKIFELYSDKVTIGEDLKNTMFELPPGVTVLKK
ncbi:MAG: hypothetical protein M3N54_07975 [Acidobacteriota bacterium]|nr:hypothetical protein [Acidobacteriota bacterium]